MTSLAWILGSGLLMSAIALVGSLTLLVSRDRLRRALPVLVALASGSLIGGAMFHMLPEAVAGSDGGLAVWAFAVLGFLAFLLIEELLHWHHGHVGGGPDPLAWVVLVADAVHNLIGGVAVASAFLVDVRVGVSAWIAAAAHEIPQELGDFGVLVHAGLGVRRALWFNLLSALTFPLGGLLTWSLARALPLDGLLAFAAGAFLYLGAVDLLPEFRDVHGEGAGPARWIAFGTGLGGLLGVRLALG